MTAGDLGLPLFQEIISIYLHSWNPCKNEFFEKNLSCPQKVSSTRDELRRYWSFCLVVFRVCVGCAALLITETPAKKAAGIQIPGKEWMSGRLREVFFFSSNSPTFWEFFGAGPAAIIYPHSGTLPKTTYVKLRYIAPEN